MRSLSPDRDRIYSRPPGCTDCTIGEARSSSTSAFVSSVESRLLPKRTLYQLLRGPSSIEPWRSFRNALMSPIRASGAKVMSNSAPSFDFVVAV